MADAAHHGSASNFRTEAEPSRLQARALASRSVPLGPMTTIPRFDRLSHATGLSLVRVATIAAPRSELERPRPVPAALVDLAGDGRLDAPRERALPGGAGRGRAFAGAPGGAGGRGRAPGSPGATDRPGLGRGGAGQRDEGPASADLTHADRPRRGRDPPRRRRLPAR